MKKLVKGILEFRQNVREEYRETFAKLALGQSPDALFITCSDSRVAPNLFASTNPGDLFVIRNMGNLIPPYTNAEEKHGVAEAAALEFSLSTLPIRNIIVCGHSECGAMHAVMSGLDNVSNPLMRGWLRHCQCPAQVAHELQTPLSPHNHLSQLNVLRQIEHLKTYPLVQEKMQSEMLKIHGWYFDIAKAEIHAYEEEFGKFILIDEEEGERILKKLS